MEHLNGAPRPSQDGLKPLDQEVWRAWQDKNHLAEGRRAVTRMKAVKWACIAILIVTGVLFSPLSPCHVIVRFLVALGALAVMVQGLHTQRYAFTALFAGLVCLYNPFVPTFAFSGSWQRWLVFASALPFLMSLIWMNAMGRAVSAKGSRTTPV
jgi:hypothetical protein